MKRKISALILVTLMLLSVLTGCGGTDGTSQPSETGGGSLTSSRELRLSMPVPEGSDTYNQALAAKEYIEISVWSPFF